MNARAVLRHGAGFLSFWTGRGEMYIAGIGFIVFIFAVLLMLGVIPFTPVVVGALIAGLCCGVAGPVFIKTAV